MLNLLFPWRSGEGSLGNFLSGPDVEVLNPGPGRPPWSQGCPLQGRVVWVVLEFGVPFRVLFVRVPYYIGDLESEGDPNLEISGPEQLSILLLGFLILIV